VKEQNNIRRRRESGEVGQTLVLSGPFGCYAWPFGSSVAACRYPRQRRVNANWGGHYEPNGIDRNHEQPTQNAYLFDLLDLHLEILVLCLVLSTQPDVITTTQQLDEQADRRGSGYALNVALLC
jgi:hypothetical protein